MVKNKTFLTIVFNLLEVLEKIMEANACHIGYDLDFGSIVLLQWYKPNNKFSIGERKEKKKFRRI